MNDDVFISLMFSRIDFNACRFFISCFLKSTKLMRWFEAVAGFVVLADANLVSVQAFLTGPSTRGLHLKSSRIPSTALRDSSSDSVSDSTDSDATSTRDGRQLSRIPRLAKLGLALETQEEYAARRAATVAKHGGSVSRPESEEKYKKRILRNEKMTKERQEKRARYEAMLNGELPERDFNDISNGDELEGVLISKLLKSKGPKAKTKPMPKAWFDVGVWRRRKDGFPTRVSAQVRLYQEDINELGYFERNEDRTFRLYVQDAQHASARLVASFSRPGVPRYGRLNGGVTAELSADPKPGEYVLDELKPGTKLIGKVQTMTSHACWLQVPVMRRSKKDGLLRPVNARLHLRTFDKTTVLATNIIRGEEVERVINRGDELTVYVSEVYEHGKFDVSFDIEDVEVTAAKRETMLKERRRKNRQRTRRAKATKALLEAATNGVDVIRQGEVVRVEQYGLIVDIGATKKGLVHISDLAKSDWTGKPPPVSEYGDGAAYVSNIKALINVGQKLRVKLKPLKASGSSVNMGFEIVEWIDGIPVDPSYEEPADASAKAEEAWDWAKDIDDSKRSSGMDQGESSADIEEQVLGDDEDDYDEDDDYEDEQDRWESKLGYDQEYY